MSVDTGLLMNAYFTQDQIRGMFDALDARLKEVEKRSSRMRLAKADLLRLQPGDILAIHVNRPLAESESRAIAQGFADLFAAVGLERVHAIVFNNVDGQNIDLSVIRQENVVDLAQSHGISG